MSGDNEVRNMKIAILCGGRGKRLNSITCDLPKPLIALNGRPILEHILDFFGNKGFREFMFCTGYKGSQIIDFVEKYKKGRVGNYEFSDKGDDASILQRIFALKDNFRDRIFCTYGDTLTDLEMPELVSSHEKSGALMTMVVSKIRTPFGLVEKDQGGRVLSFVEKPMFNYYIGHMIIERRALDHVTNEMLEQSDGNGLVMLFSNMIDSGSLNAYEHHGAQITFNTEAQLASAEEQIIDFYSQKEGI
jgi:glucose-1-phosphate cytidylyltransferase